MEDFQRPLRRAWLGALAENHRLDGPPRRGNALDGGFGFLDDRRFVDVLGIGCHGSRARCLVSFRMSGRLVAAEV